MGPDFEEEATRRFGPPDVRAQKNRRYVARLVRKYSEETIRGVLKALSEVDATFAENLAEHDLDTEPLEQIIRRYELLGFDLRVVSTSDTTITVDVGEAYGTVGSGGTFVLERLGPGSYRIAEDVGQWIA